MLGKNIKELRQEKGYTQAELAELVGATQGAIYFWEKGINEPTAGYLIKLAQVFSVSVDELLSFEAENKSEKALRASEINTYFNKLTSQQQQLLINMAKELLKG